MFEMLFLISIVLICQSQFLPKKSSRLKKKCPAMNRKNNHCRAKSTITVLPTTRHQRSKPNLVGSLVERHVQHKQAQAG